MTNPSKSDQIADSVGRAGYKAAAPTVAQRLVRLECLVKLRNLQVRLDDYLTGYVSFRELAEACREASARLELGKQQPFRMIEPQYWKDLQKDLDSASVSFNRVPQRIRSDFKEVVDQFGKALEEVVEQFGKSLEEARRLVADIIRSPQGDTVNISSTVHRCVGIVQLDINTIANKCKTEVDGVLSQIKEEIRVIFEQVDYGRAGMGDEASEPAGSYDEKQQEAAKERSKIVHSTAEKAGRSDSAKVGSKHE